MKSTLSPTKTSQKPARVKLTSCNVHLSNSRFLIILVANIWNNEFFDSDYEDKYDVLFFNQFDDLKMSNASITGSLGIVHRMNDLNKISFNLSSGFRSPNIDDIGKIRENAGVLSVPNMNLKPEYVYTLDCIYHIIVS